MRKRQMIESVEQTRIRETVFYLAADPLPCRRLNYTLPWHDRCTLYEADSYIRDRLDSFGYSVETQSVPVQAFRRDESKPLAHQYSPPLPSDPWYDAVNLYAKKLGTERPNELIVVVSHKDSQSWLDVGPGANDNAVGTAANMEIARVLADYEAQRSVWFLFCNEEHTPWTSIAAAQSVARSGMEVVAVLNLDGPGVKSEADRAAGRMTNVTGYTTDEGEALADLMAKMNAEYGIGLEQSKYRFEGPGNDDGSFINAGFARAVINIGSMPYADPNYHTENDTADLVDYANARLTTQLTLAAVLDLDSQGV